ncbi:FtsX-like permease family protein [Ilyomonas limi]|uniref:FtsX-like permease family protein n=1 Tax=Ilyomonas limi TaxID=2575867 RepID=A0A4U3L204_9BACT|nr:ABC transporter permease [Ilyomonas limi]TKK68259.1 FtsX-like permease family protein [Ilyomonas limi]
MFKNYLKTAWRSLTKSAIFSFINVFGLTIGFTSFLLIALYVFDEFTFDAFHKNTNNIYRVVADETTPEGKETKSAGAGYQISQKAVADLPEIKDAARFITFGRLNVSNAENTNVFYEDFTVANPGFLTVFDFKLLQGDRHTALTQPHAVIVTEETAQKLFNTTDVVGKVVKIDRDSLPYKITGVLKNFPANSHIAFNLLFSESSIDGESFKNFINSDWTSGEFSTYLLLSDKADAKKVAAKINALVSANANAESSDKSSYILQPLKAVHFYSNDIEGSANKGNITYMYVFSVIALFILLIACINYMNLTTAGFAKRAKEIAVRKVAGASKQMLVKQFLTEAFLLTAIALVLALLLVEILLPFFNTFTEKQLTLGFHTDYRIWLGIVAAVVVVALLSGSYPALFQARLKPLQLLKSKINIGKGNLSLRKSLVVFQFALSIIMIIATTIVYLQIQYVNTKDMGFNKEQLLVVDINSGKVRNKAATIKNEFSKLAQVKEVTVSSRVPGEWKVIPKIKVKNEKIQSVEGEDMYFLGVDDQFLKTYQISLAKGRNFLRGSIADSSTVIINETAAKELGITEPKEQLIEMPGDEPFTARVIGIVKDFNFQSLREPLAPMILGYQNNPVQAIDYFTARVNTKDVSKTLAAMNDMLHTVDQNHLFEYHFLDKQWDLFYREDHIRETIFMIVSMLTILIACLGLFGLTTYEAAQRIKEIGIRKVLGASVSSIVILLSKSFLKLVGIAAILAFPIAWLAMHKWLQEFAYRIHVQWWVFVLAGLTAAAIAFVTIGLQAVKAAMANPVKSLRSE